MNGWHPIEPEPQRLTESEQAVKKLLDSGMSYPMIAIKLHMSHETTRDIIFEIRKKEGIMRKPTITDEEKLTMKRMHAEGKTIHEIADATGRGRSSVDRIVHDRCEAAQIAAANEARLAAEVAELEDVENGIPNTPLISANAEENSANAEPEKIPHVIWCALDDQCSAINMEIETRDQRIAELQEEIQKLQTMKREIQEWMEVHT